MLDAVFIHGTPLDRHAWDPLIRELPQVRAVTYDLPGHGTAAKEELPDSYDQLADDLVRVLDAHDLGRAHVIGHSFGAQVVANFAVRYPERTSSVAIVCCRLVPYPPFAAAADAIASGGMEAIREAAIQRWFTPKEIERESAAVQYARERMEAVRPETLAKAFRLIAAFEGVSALAAAGVKTQIVAAERDTVGEPRGLKAAAAVIPGARFSLVEGVGHMLPLEQPVRLARELRIAHNQMQ